MSDIEQDMADRVAAFDERVSKGFNPDQPRADDGKWTGGMDPQKGASEAMGKPVSKAGAVMMMHMSNYHRAMAVANDPHTDPATRQSMLKTASEAHQTANDLYSRGAGNEGANSSSSIRSFNDFSEASKRIKTEVGAPASAGKKPGFLSRMFGGS